MNNRPLIIFLMINFVIGTFVIINFSNKNSSKKVAVNETIITEMAEDNNRWKEQESKPLISVPTVITQSTPIVSSTPPITLPEPVQKTLPPLCMVYGPITVAQKSIFDNVVVSEKLVPQASFIKQNEYEIYWNLGANEAVAKEIFEKQKRDALKDDKFKLSNSDGMWIVSIANIKDNLETAKALATQLSEKANKVNAGGKWQYRTLPETYYYQLKNVNLLTPNSLAKITSEINVPKKVCSA